MDNLIEFVFKYKVRPELEAFGDELNIEEIEHLIDQLPSNFTIAKRIIELTSESKNKLAEYSKRIFGFTEGDHIYIRGTGIYNDRDEILLDKENWHYYQRHRNFIQDNVFKNKHEIVESIDYETDQIIKKFPKPSENESINKKGLIIGYVQSGKTANFTHLISKASSIGYKFIVVLAGMTDTLRKQTQFRLDKELIGVNTLGLDDIEVVKWLPGEEKYTPLTGLPDLRIKKDNGDFYIPVTNFTDHFNNSNDVTIAIIKKLARNNGDRFGALIGNLINWIENRHNKNSSNMPPLLIIDDEADQASIDSTDEDTDPTVINHAIRKLISLFPKSVYVGYTATPFANVFINPTSDFLGLEDLYPKDFIYSLPEPDDYFGSKQFFNIKNNKGELALIEYVEGNEREIINDEGLNITIGLKKSIRQYLYSVIIRRYRDNDKYCSMMIHTDHRNVNHNTVYSKVKDYISQCIPSEDLFNEFNASIDNSKSIGRLQGINNNYPIYNYEQFIREFDCVLDKLKTKKNSKTTNIRVINSREDKLDYLNEDLQYLICIGGNIMSRGVTIEGLTITYYLRSTMKYDTLLQMGRWFGYRKGYEDLLRLYTTKNIADNFEFIMGVEDDLRNEVNRYIEEGLTPLDFSPKVRAHMRMFPSSKMGNASLTKSYSQQAIQTIYFTRDLETLNGNYKLAVKLISDNIGCIKNIDSYQHKYIAEKIKIDSLKNFLNEYQFTEYNTFSVPDIIKYINVRVNSGEIKDFNIIISGIKNKIQDSESTSISDISVNPVKRNFRTSKGEQYIDENIVNIGVISDTSDIRIADDSERLTLILYFIDHKRSNVFNKSNTLFNSKDLDFNPLGFTIVFPKTNISNGELNYYQQIFD